MATVGGIGIGLFVLAFVWALCIFLCIAFSRAQGGVAFAAVGFILIAVILTLVLWFMPRGAPPPEESYIKYDDMYVSRTVLISFVGIFAFLGLAFWTFLHFFEAQRTDRLKKMRAF
jgi:amino acid transporter